MKKTITLTLLILIAAFRVQAQNDTLVYENFDVDNSASWAIFNSGNDTTWVSFDLDALADANGRPGNWFWNATAFGGNDTTGCIFSSSWFGVPAACANYFITPPIDIIDATAVLNWRSCPRQTPRYLDGYKILVSTTDNFESSFTDTIFEAGEYLSGAAANGYNFSLYGFSNGFIHGADTLYVEFETDSSAFIGLMRPFSVSLAQYSGQTIYIAFLHDAFDDNLIAVDDILVTGSLTQGLNEEEVLTNATVYPNPASERVQLRFNKAKAGVTSFRIYDLKGNLVKTRDMQLSGFAQEVSIPVVDLSAGNYIVVAQNGNASTRLPLVIVK